MLFSTKLTPISETFQMNSKRFILLRHPAVFQTFFCIVDKGTLSFDDNWVAPTVILALSVFPSSLQSAIYYFLSSDWGKTCLWKLPINKMKTGFLTILSLASSEHFLGDDHWTIFNTALCGMSYFQILDLSESTAHVLPKSLSYFF